VPRSRRQPGPWPGPPRGPSPATGTPSPRRPSTSRPTATAAPTCSGASSSRAASARVSEPPRADDLEPMGRWADGPTWTHNAHTFSFSPPPKAAPTAGRDDRRSNPARPFPHASLRLGPKDDSSPTADSSLDARSCYHRSPPRRPAAHSQFCFKSLFKLKFMCHFQTTAHFLPLVDDKS
jgi:hypothetical protein